MLATEEPRLYGRRAVLGMVNRAARVVLSVRLADGEAPLALGVSKQAARRLVRRAKGKVTAHAQDVFGETELFIGAIG
jgi:hypothetical protein